MRAGRWGQRFGWIAALAVALVALIFALLAFTNSDATSHVRRHAGGFAPYGRADDGFGRAQPPGPRPGDALPR